MTTPEDLRWWLALAPTLRWTFAKTYAASAPHSYVVAGRTSGLTGADFVRAGRVIRTFGQPGKFYSYTNVYLTSADGRLKWWTMDADVADTDLINQASTDRVYGHQDAPATATGTFTACDAIACDYDRTRDASRDEWVRLHVVHHFGEHRPTTLDVGCGTGALLDLGVTDPGRYTGVDSSQAMLNVLVLKHPGVARLVPARFEDVPAGALAPAYELVVAMDVPGVDVRRLGALACGLLLVSGPQDEGQGPLW